MSIYDEALEKLESIKKETYEVYREGYYQPDIHEVFDEYDGRIWQIESALKKAKQLDQDVKRYFEIYNCELKQGKWWEEYTALKEKLSKVGK